MKRETLDFIFVLAVFAIAYTVVAKGASLTGRAIYLGGTPEPSEDAVTVLLTRPMNIEIDDLTQRSKVYIKDGERQYSIEVWHLVQDYERGEEYVNLRVTPGDKLIRLREKESQLVDFDNSGDNDALVTVTDISHGQATVTLTTPKR